MKEVVSSAPSLDSFCALQHLSVQILKKRRADFISKMFIALKEARETSYWLKLLSATKILSESKIADLAEETTQLCKIIGAIIVSTKNSKPEN